MTGAQWGLWLVLSTVAIATIPPLCGWLIGFALRQQERRWLVWTVHALRGGMRRMGRGIRRSRQHGG